ncbi:RNA polymerase subunit sigma-24, partial [Paracidovorax avenae]
MTDPATLFDRHRPRLYAIAYRMLGDVAEAEDVV